MDPETALKIGELTGTIRACAERVAQIDDKTDGLIRDVSANRTETARLVTAVEDLTTTIKGSGPQTALRPEQPATEPIERRHSGTISKLLSGKNTPWIITCLTILVALVIVVSAITGRPPNSLVPTWPAVLGSEPTSRPALITTPEGE